MAEGPNFRVGECLWKGVYILKVNAKLTMGDAERVVHRALQGRIEAGIRHFIVDLTNVEYADSSGLGALFYGVARIRLRRGRIIWVAVTHQVREVLRLTRMDSVMEFSTSISEALASLLDEPVLTEPALVFDDVDEREWRERKSLVEVSDKTLGAAQNTGPSEPRAHAELSSPGRRRMNSLGSVLGATGAAIVLFVATIGSLVWAAKEVPSTALLTLIFAVAIIFEVNLALFIFIVTGSVSEKTAQKVMGTTLGKVPGLKLWVPRIARATQSPDRSD